MVKTKLWFSYSIMDMKSIKDFRYCDNDKLRILQDMGLIRRVRCKGNEPWTSISNCNKCIGYLLCHFSVIELPCLCIICNFFLVLFLSSITFILRPNNAFHFLCSAQKSFNLTLYLLVMLSGNIFTSLGTWQCCSQVTHFQKKKNYCPYTWQS